MSSITSSGEAEQESLCPLWASYPLGFLPLGFRRIFVLLTTTSFILFLLRVAAVQEFFPGFSYLDKCSLKFTSSSSFLRILWFIDSMLRFNLAISAYCRQMVLSINHISSAMFCNIFDMSVLSLS